MRATAILIGAAACALSACGASKVADIPPPPPGAAAYAPLGPYAAQVDTVQTDLNDELQRMNGPMRSASTYALPAEAQFEAVRSHYAGALQGWSQGAPPVFHVRHASASVWSAGGRTLAVALTDRPPFGATDIHKVLLVVAYGR